MTSSKDSTPTMTADAFLTWSEGNPQGRHELLDGIAVRMSAERLDHAQIKGDVYALFKRGIAEAGLPCQAFVDGMAVTIDGGSVFEPDALVRCGPRLPGDTLSIDDPLIVVEVVSPSSQRLDVLTKLTRYFRNPHIVHYLIVVPTECVAIHHRRNAEGTIETQSYDGDATIMFDPPGLRLPLPEVFAES